MKQKDNQQTRNIDTFTRNIDSFQFQQSKGNTISTFQYPIHDVYNDISGSNSQPNLNQLPTSLYQKWQINNLKDKLSQQESFNQELAEANKKLS